MGSRLGRSNYAKEEETMLKRGLAILLMAILVGLFPSTARADGGGGDPAIADKLAQLEAAVGNLEEMVKELAFDAQRLASLEAIVKEISFQMKESEGKIRDLQAFRQGVEQDLRPRVVKLESGVAGLSFTVRKQGEKLTKLEGLGDVVAELRPRVFSLETTVEGLAAKLEAVEAKLKDLDGVPDKIADLEGRLSEVEGILAAISPDGVDLSGLKELKDKVFVLQNALADLASKIDGEKMAELDRRLSAVEAQMRTLAGDLKALEERVTELDQGLSNVRSWATLSTVMAVAAVAGFAYLMFFAR